MLLYVRILQLQKCVMGKLIDASPFFLNLFNLVSDPTLKSAGWSISMMTGGRVVSAALG